MKIYIGIDNHDIDKFKSVARTLSSRIENDNIGNLESIKKYTKGDNDICLLFSNRINYIENFVKDTSCEVINVTDNLSSSYIVAVLKHVKDIYYLRADINTLIERLTKRINCMGNNAKVK